jgi:hypothetical protein
MKERRSLPSWFKVVYMTFMCPTKGKSGYVLAIYGSELFEDKRLEIIKA